MREDQWDDEPELIAMFVEALGEDNEIVRKAFTREQIERAVRWNRNRRMFGEAPFDS